MNPNCDSCCGEDAEHCLCSECMKESAAADQLAERKAIVDWLTSKTVAYGEQPNLDHLIDAINRGEHLAPPKRIAE